MNVAHYSLRIDDRKGGHPAQTEKSDLLSVKVCNPVGRIGTTGKGHIVSIPVSPEIPGIFRAKDENLGVELLEFTVVPAQLRHMAVAEGSGKSAVEDQHHAFLTQKIPETYCLSIAVIDGEIRCGSVQLNHGI